MSSYETDTEESQSECAPIVDAVPCSVVFIGDLLDPSGVIQRILLQKMVGQPIEGRDKSLASSQFLEKSL